MSGVCSQPFTSADKWYSALISGLVFAILSSSCSYTWTNGMTKNIGMTISSSQGCPNMAGLFLHAILFTIIIRLLMQVGNSAHCGSPKDKTIISEL